MKTQLIHPLAVATALLAVPIAATPFPTMRVGDPLPAWQEGFLDIHKINTGKGDAAFFILPDGTTLLLDTGDMERSRPPGYDAPARPDNSRRPGEWVTAYIRAAHPQGEQAVLDYAVSTHFHADHYGQVKEGSLLSGTGAYRLTGITDVAETIPVRRVLDRGWPDYTYPTPLTDPTIENYREFLRWQVEHRGLRVERFEAGRNDQIVLLHAPEKFPGFEVRNISVNGYAWTGDGTETRNRFPRSDPPSENNSSIVFRLNYGRFGYFNGGDLTCGNVPRQGRPEWRDMESAVAWAVGPVDVHVLNHHGFKDSATEFFLSVLQPRIHIIQAYASSHPAPDVMRRMLSDSIYPGERDIFITDGHWDGRRSNMVQLFGEEDTAWLEARMNEAAATQGHIVVRVAPGGGSYHVVVLDDKTESPRILSIHGPYQSR